MLRSLRSHPATYWVAAGLLALLTAGASWSLLHRADIERRAWGTQRVVPVATRPVAAGARLTEADVERRELPVALLPDAPVADDPVGRVVAGPLAAGELVLRSRLVEGATLPPGSVVVSVAADRLGEPPPPGTRVVLIDADDTGTTARGSVVDSADGVVRVAVTVDDAVRLAPAIRAGDVVLAIG